MTQDEQEPLAWIDDSGHPKHRSYRQTIEEKKLFGALRPLYAHTQLKRKPLSDGVMCDIAHEHGLMNIDWIDFARAIEAAHGITKG